MILRGHRVYAVIIIVVTCLLLPAMLAPRRVSAQIPARDLHKEPTGSASISGIVQTTDPTPRPLRLATVTLSGDQLYGDRRLYTNNEGRFEFAGLPAGRYTIQSYKSGYMRESYGAKHQGGSGATIVVADGQKMTEAAIGLSKYGVISGAIYDQNGEPAQGVSVEVMAYTMRTGRRTLSSVYGKPQTTDDRGMYRAGGLVPGEYFVAAGPSSYDGSVELQVLSAEDIDRALRSVAPSALSQGAPQPAPMAPRVTLAPMFYPGTADLSSATKITLKSGEERTDIDVSLHAVPTSSIDGVATYPGGLPAANAQIVATLVTDAFSLDLFRGTLDGVRPDAQGHFVYRGLSPGRYVITARGTPDSTDAPGRPMPGAGPLWALAEVSVNGADQSVALALQTGMSVSGRVVFAGTKLPQPPSLATVRVSMPPATTSVSIGVAPPLVNADGTFTLTGAAPGLYKLSGTAPPAAPGWMLRSAMVNGVDALDVPFEIKPGQGIDGAVLSFTDQPTELSGTLQAPDGIAAANYFIIVFAADRAFWTPASRRIAMVRPGTTGTYAVRNLPPGDYFVSAVTDVDYNSWFDPAFLDQLVPAATKVVLAESEKKAFDLKIGR